MEIRELYRNLLNLNTVALSLLDSVSYRNSQSLDLVEYDINNADDCMFIEEFRSIFTHIDYINSALTYLQQPIIEIGTLHFVESGIHKLNQITLTTNDVVELFYFDENSGTSFWRPTLLHPHSNYNEKRARIRAYKNTPLV